MEKWLVAFTLLVSTAMPILAQDKATLSGFIKDGSTGEELIGAAVYVDELKTGGVTNVYGFYSITLPVGKYKLIYSFVGFEKQEMTIDLQESKTIDIELNSSVSDLEVVEITSERKDGNVKSIEMSVNKMEIETIKKIPAFLGEVDVIRSIQTLPGVSTVGEGATGFNVRGGGIDQNLVLLDEAPVYNSSHLFGFFSVFNPDAVKSVKLIKGGIPAQYGGRTSSLLDVRMKEGNKKKFAMSGGIGAIFSRLTIEAPIKKDKASFLIAGRRSYVDVLAAPFLNESLSGSRFFFYDLTAKVNYKVDDKNRLFLSGYLGKDVFGAGFAFDWGSQTATARWNHIFSDKIFLNMTAFYSRYDYSFLVGEDDDQFNWSSNIVNYSLKPEFIWYWNTQNTITFGGQAIFFDFAPGRADFASDGAVNDISLDDKKALENALYIGNEQRIGSRLSLQYGIRYSNYSYLGSGTAYTLGDTTAGLQRPVESQEEFDSWETIQNYGNFEPRFSAKFDLTETSSVKASYNRITQYIHLMSNTAAATPIDVWTPSTNNIKPQIADQVALGYFKNFKNNAYETSVEVYYKDMQNQVEYIDNANLLLNEFIEADLLRGDGRAYGAEFYVKKNNGPLTGWISYTIAKTERQTEGINQDDWYPARFDKPQNINVSASYEFNERISVSGNFVYTSGTPATFPTNRVPLQTWVIPHNAENRRNNYRVPAYHRLDFSATYTPKKNEGRRWKSSWVASVYNVYNRRNPFTVFFQPNETNTQATEAIRYSVIGSVIPSISYNFTF